MVAGPELVRISTEFEASIKELHKRTSEESRHHDQTKSTQVTFAQHVKCLVGVMEEMGNSFLEESKDLLRLDTRSIVDEAVASSICQAAERGKEQFQAFVTNRQIEGSTLLAEPIKKNSLVKGRSQRPAYKYHLEEQCLFIFKALHSMSVTRWRP